MKGTFYVVGVGPGDPELLTLKAARILAKSPVWLVPAAKKNGRSTALEIAGGAVDSTGKKIITHHFPMQKVYGGQPPEPLVVAAWEQAAALINEHLRAGRDVALPTLGDPALYSTGFYVCETMLAYNPKAGINIISGVSAVGAASAAAGIPLCLGDERLMVIPAVFADNYLRQALRDFDTVVFMKVHKALPRLVPLLEELGLLDMAVLVERADMADQRIWRDVRAARDEKLHYFSTMIVRKK